MDKTDIIIRNVICNELRRSNKNTIVTQLAEIDTEMNHFLKAHIAKIINSNELKSCEFQEDSYLKKLLEHFNEENLVQLNQDIGNRLHQLMIEHENILESELIILTYQYHSNLYLGMLKMNYKEKYTHRENTAGLKKIETLPIRMIQEAAIFSVSEHKVFVKEQKVKINGIGINYFSAMFLQCGTKLSEKEKFTIVRHVLGKTNDQHETDGIEKEIKLRMEVLNQLEENGVIEVPELIENLYDEAEKTEIIEKLQHYKIEREKIQIDNSTLLKKIKSITVINHSGYEIVIPIEEIQKGTIELQETEQGTKNVIFKDIVTKF